MHVAVCAVRPCGVPSACGSIHVGAHASASCPCHTHVRTAQDLARRGRHHGVCPYYGARRLVPEADVILVRPKPFGSTL